MAVDPISPHGDSAASALTMNRLGDYKVSGGYNIDGDRMLSLENGGQHGMTTALGKVVGGKNYSEWINDHSYVSRNLIAVLLQYPKFFDLMNQPQTWKITLKTMLELHTKTIDGLKGGMTVESAEETLGGAGEVRQQPINTTRERSEPVHTMTEKAGMPIYNFLQAYIRYGIMDPDTKGALVGTLKSFKSDVYTPDFYTFSVIYFEPDITFRNVLKAFLCTNMYPQSDGGLEAKRDLTAGGEVKTIDLALTAITIQTKAVKDLARSIMFTMNTTKIDPHYIHTIVARDIDEARETDLKDEKEAPNGVMSFNYRNSEIPNDGLTTPFNGVEPKNSTEALNLATSEPSRHALGDHEA